MHKLVSPIVGIQVDEHTSAFGVVCKAVEALLATDMPDVIQPNGQKTPMAFVVQSLPYAVGTHAHSDPWGDNYPTLRQAIALCQEHAPVQINVRKRGGK
jgi:hypothetical protein